MLRNNSKQSGESMYGESWRRKRKGCGGKDLQKRKVLSLEWKLVDDGIPSNSKNSNHHSQVKN